MSRGTAARLAWSLCAALPGADGAKPPALEPEHLSSWHSSTTLARNTLGALSYAPVGAFGRLASPGNPVGWLMCLYGLVYQPRATSVPSTPSTPCWRNPARSRRVKRWPGSFLDTAHHHRSFGVLHSCCSPPEGYRAGAGGGGVADCGLGRAASGYRRVLLWSAMGILGPIRNPLGIEGSDHVYDSDS